MYAIIKCGGHQYKVEVGDKIAVDRVAGKEGESVSFSQVLSCVEQGNPRWGTPYIAGAEVQGKIVAHKKHPKIVVFKYKRRKNYKRTKGWKQPYSEIEITAINVSNVRGVPPL